MNWLWWYWPFALVFVALVLFAVPEYLAIRWKGPTFSEFMAFMSRKTKFGPVWTFLWGMLVGGLVIHFSGWCV